MAEGIGFSGSGEQRPVPAPADTGTQEAFAVMGNCAAGLMFGSPTTEIPPGGDPEEPFRHLVKHAFDGVPGFRFGVVIGRNSLA